MHKHALVALVGRPNVGKSALFNRLTGKGRAIVDDMPGLTRDRHYGYAEWLGRQFIVVDTGGLDLKNPDPLNAQVQEQTRLAIVQADLIVWLVDGHTTLSRTEQELAALLRQSGKPVLLAVNKIDTEAQESVAQEFWQLGFPNLFLISAVHGRRIDELLDALLERLPPDAAPSPEEDLTVQLAVVGRPNVGKSSLVNRLLGEKRMLVSDIPGTTRDAVDSVFEHAGRRFRIVDTAGIKAPRATREGLEHYTVVRTLRSIEESHVVLLLLDATEPLSEQDERIAGFIHESGRACLLVVNKWDAVAKDDQTSEHYIKTLRRRMPFLDYAPIITLSAKTGQRVNKLLELVAYVDEQHVMRFKTSLLNQALQDILRKHPEPSRRGKSLKVHYLSQTGVRPPAFALFVNDPARMHFAYLRHIKNELRARFGLEGTPLIIMLRGRKEKRHA